MLSTLKRTIIELASLSCWINEIFLLFSQNVDQLDEISCKIYSSVYIELSISSFARKKYGKIIWKAWRLLYEAYAVSRYPFSGVKTLCTFLIVFCASSTFVDKMLKMSFFYMWWNYYAWYKHKSGILVHFLLPLVIKYWSGGR